MEGCGGLVAGFGGAGRWTGQAVYSGPVHGAGLDLLWGTVGCDRAAVFVCQPVALEKAGAFVWPAFDWDDLCRGLVAR